MRLFRNCICVWLLLAAQAARALAGDSENRDVKPVLALPVRPVDAPAGSRFAGSVWNLSLAERDAHMLREITAGNVPEFLRVLVPVGVTNVVAGVTNTATFFACADYLSIGSAQDYLRVPMQPATAQKIADALGCSLPTPKMVDAIWQAATVKLPPLPIPPTAAMTTVAVFSNHNSLVQEQMNTAPPGGPQGSRTALIAGHKKDVVISARLRGADGKIAIYGWHRTNGIPIQPLYLGHSATWVDYSQCVRLVSREVVVNGTRILLRDALADPSLAGLFSGEGVIDPPRYLTPK